MNDRIEKLARDFADRKLQENQTWIEERRRLIIESFLAGALAQDAESRTTRREGPEWHEAVVTREQTRE